jgi:transcriptional regulator with XRE-family HTH domain
MGRSRQPRPEKLAGKLREIRLRMGLTQKEMFERLRDRDPHLYIGHISLFESGDRVPSLLVLLGYARAGQVSLESLLDDALTLQKLTDR